MSAPPTPAHAADPGRRADDDDFSTAATAAENTPLLRSPTSSTGTLRDGSSSSRPDGGHSGDVTEEPVLGWKRAVCIILSMWALIFLQGEHICRNDYVFSSNREQLPTRLA